MSENQHERRGLLTPLVILIGLSLLAVVAWLAGRMDTVEERVDESLPQSSGVTPGSIPRVIVRGERVYVSLYSQVYQQGGEVLPLSGTLSVRNTDETHPITVTVVDYFDSGGKRVRAYVDGPQQIAPLGSTNFVVSQADLSGGVGANFIVEWVAEAPVLEPVVEAVMVGRSGTGLCSFVCEGRVLRRLEPDEAR